MSGGRGTTVARVLAATVVGVGTLGLLGQVVLLAGRPALDDVLAAAIPAAFLVAGALGLAARPDRRDLRRLAGVGSLHLCGFSLVDLADRHRGSNAAWFLGAAGDTAYLAGFAVLALLVLSYPTGTPVGRVQRVATWAVTGLTAAAVALELAGRPVLTLASGAPPIPVPAPLPLVVSPVSVAPVVPLLVVAAVVVRAATARRLDGEDRRALDWGLLATGVLALLLLVSPAAGVLLPASAWDVLFPALVIPVPFLLLAGLVRFRLLRVDLYLVRTLGRGLVGVVLLSAYAGLAVLLECDALVAVGAAVTVVAALLGKPVVVRVERVVDRLLTGGRVGRHDVLDHVLALVADHTGTRVPVRIEDAVAAALDAAWVRLEPGGTPLAPADRPAVSVDLLANGTVVGRIDAGPRRGGWSGADRDLLARLAGPIALLVRERQLAGQLADRVAELRTSRQRLVRAEDTARRRIERDLHDGVQQELVALLAQLGLLEAELSADASPSVRARVGVATRLARDTLTQLRTLVAGIHPPVLTDRGLTAAVQSRIAELPITVELDTDPRLDALRPDPQVEGAAWFVVSEALTNVIKHSGSTLARVELALEGDRLLVTVTDRGRGTADPSGTGLTGLADRVDALGGELEVTARPGLGSTVRAAFPHAWSAVPSPADG